jgi:hypothetical protein
MCIIPHAANGRNRVLRLQYGHRLAGDKTCTERDRSAVVKTPGKHQIYARGAPWTSTTLATLVIDKGIRPHSDRARRPMCGPANKMPAAPSKGASARAIYEEMV